jgi:hypothetical protein
VSARIISSSKSGRLTDLQQNATFSSRIRVAQNAYASEIKTFGQLSGGGVSMTRSEWHEHVLGRQMDGYHWCLFCTGYDQSCDVCLGDGVVEFTPDLAADAETIWLNRDLWKSQEPPSKGGAVEAGDVR